MGASSGKAKEAKKEARGEKHTRRMKEESREKKDRLYKSILSDLLNELLLEPKQSANVFHPGVTLSADVFERLKKVFEEKGYVLTRKEDFYEDKISPPLMLTEKDIPSADDLASRPPRVIKKKKVLGGWHLKLSRASSAPAVSPAVSATPSAPTPEEA